MLQQRSKDESRSARPKKTHSDVIRKISDPPIVNETQTATETDINHGIKIHEICLWSRMVPIDNRIGIAIRTVTPPLFAVQRICIKGLFRPCRH